MSYAPFPLIWGGSGGGGGGPSFGVIQTDTGTSPTASGSSDILTFTSDSVSNYYFEGTALTDTVTFKAPGLLLTSTFNDYNLVQKEPTGFPNRTDSTLSFNNSTRVFTIAPAVTSFDFYVRGNKYTKSTSQTTTIPNNSGNHYIYFDLSGNLQNTQTVSADLYQDNALVAIIYWNTDTSTQTYFAEERHGLIMDGGTHSYLHTVFGARYISGFSLLNFTIGSGSANADAQFTSDAGSLRDEDILLSPAAQSQIPILYKQGTQWRKKTADSYPVIYSGTAGYTGASGRLPYNLLSGGTWSLSEVPNNNFVLAHFFATNDINNPVVGIQGISTYTSISAARTGANVEINSLTGLPFAEVVPIGSVIFETANSYSNTPKARVRQTDTGDNYVDFRGSSGTTISAGTTIPLNDLADVVITTPSNNDVLTYNSSTNTWVNAVGSSGGITSLNSQTGASQTFANDTNINISSAGDVHSLVWAGTLSEGRGGTGTGTYATGDILYASTTNTLAKLPIGNSGEVLTVSGAVPVWAAGGGGGVTAGTNIENISGTVSALTKTVTDSGVTAFQNDYAPTGWGTDVSVLRIDASNFIFLTGLSAGADNQIVEIRNIGSISIGLATEHTASSAANRFDFGDSDHIIFPNMSVRVVYDSTDSRWRLLASNEWWAVESKYSFRYSWDGINNTQTAATANDFGYITGNGTAGLIFPTVAPQVLNRYGITRFSHSATVGNRMSWYQPLNNAGGFTFGTGTDASYFTFEAAVRFPNLSDSTNRYLTQFGFIDSVTGNSVDGLFALYQDDINGGAFVLRAASSLTNTDANTTITVVPDEFYRLKIMAYPNGTGRLFINGTEEAALATGLPPGGRDFGWGVNIRKISGTADRSMQIDYFGVAMGKGSRL